MELINDGYHIGDDLTTQLDAGYLMDQLKCMKSSLETLAITLETTADDSELEMVVDMISQPRRSLKHFTAMKELVVPQAFLFAPESSMWLHPGKSCRPKDLPSKLETLEILYPQEGVEDWVTGFIPTESNGKKVLPNFRELTLTCRDEVAMPVSYFTTDVESIWYTLATDYGIQTYAFCQIQESRQSLMELWLKNVNSPDSEDEWSDEDEDESDGDDDDDEMPDLIDPSEDMTDLTDPYEDMPDLVDLVATACDMPADLIEPMD
jgi:hypothetical protein